MLIERGSIDRLESDQTIRHTLCVRIHGQKLSSLSRQHREELSGGNNSYLELFGIDLLIDRLTKHKTKESDQNQRKKREDVGRSDSKRCEA